MTTDDKLRVTIMKELQSLEEKNNIQFDDESNFSKEIISARSIQELENIRDEVHYNACLALLKSCDEIINYYSKLFADTTQYNDELSQHVEGLEKINERKGFVNDLEEYKKIFDKLWSLNRKLKRNKNNLEKQSNWKFITKIYPIWFSIISVFYLGIIGFSINQGKLNFSYYLILGWFLLLLLVFGISKLIIYPFKSPFKK